MDILKTDLSLFDGIADFPYKPQFVQYQGMQMHYIDEGVGGEETFLALHGEPTWSYLYRKFIPVLSNHRFIAPDLIGFGKSDKLAHWQDYSFALHFESLLHFIETLQLKDINLIVQDWGGLLGLSVLGHKPDLFKRVIILNTYLPKGKPLSFGFKIWQKLAKYHPSLPVGKIIQGLTFKKHPKSVIDAYNAPFPNKSYKTGPKSFPLLIPSQPSHPGVTEMNKAREVLSKWTKPALVMFSDKDPAFRGLESFFTNLIPSCKHVPKITIHEASHFLQEDKGEEIANYIKLFIEERI